MLLSAFAFVYLVGVSDVADTLMIIYIFLNVSRNV